jgi:7-alpha-hydroxysteroid dehydrogenase
VILDRFRLDGKAAIVTGAGKGIGRGIALAFAEAGADVVCAARTEADLQATAEAVRERGRRALVQTCDVIETEQLEALVAAAEQELGRIDILVNNAGGTPPRPALQTSERFFEQAFRFNVTSAFNATRFAVPRMVATTGGGAVVNISSRAGDMVQTAFVAYGTAKAGLSFMTKDLAAEFAPKVRVNAIAVGGVATEALETVLTNDAIREQLEANTPMRRIGEVEDIAAAALYLASPASSWVTGKVFEVDGGATSPAFQIPVPPL